jgi:WD40 repeat protein
LRDFVNFRNDLHHTARRPDAEYERELQQRLPGFADILAGSAILHPYPLIRPITDNLAERWSGAQTGQTLSGTFSKEEIGRFGFVAEGGRFVNVEPFVMFLACGNCETDRLFLYDSQKSYGATESKKRIYMLEYDNGHRLDRYEPVEPLEARFTEELIKQVYEAFRKTMVAIERYLKDFGTLVEQHGDIVGRQFVRDRIQQFLDSRKSGVFLLTGEPGIGKTAILANLVAAELGRVHFFYRHTSGLRSPDDFINCILNSLVNKYRLELDEKTSDPKQQRTQLQNLLPVISGLLKPGEKEVIIVDALDEANSSGASDDSTAAQVIPQNLPDNVYFILSSRPNNPDLRNLIQRGDVEAFSLEAGSTQNREDAYAYVRQKLGARCDETIQRRIADRAEWNFLFLKLLCEAITKDDYSPGEVDAFLARSAGLQAWYADYWERLERRFEAHPHLLEQIITVIGAIAVAEAPVTRAQVCDSQGLSPTRFDWSLRYIGQYLDVIPVTEAGIRQRGPRELILYRLYHFSFQEFVLAKIYPDLVSLHTRWARSLANWRDLDGHEREYALRSLPDHLWQAGMWDDYVNTLIDFDYLQARAVSPSTVAATNAATATAPTLSISELLGDYRTALAVFPKDNPRRNELLAMWQFLDRDAQLLQRESDLLIQQAYNRLVWDWDETTALGRNIRGAASNYRRKVWLRQTVARTHSLAVNQPFRIRESTEIAPIWSIACSPNGVLLAAGDLHGSMTLWDNRTGDQIGKVTLGGDVRSVEFSPDSSLLACGVLIASKKRNDESGSETYDGAVCIFDLSSGKLKHMLSNHQPVFSVAFSPDGKTLASAEMAGSVVLWDVDTGHKLQTLPHHDSTNSRNVNVWHVRYSPDGRWLASVGTDGTARIWDAHTAEAVHVLAEHQGMVGEIVFTPDSHTLISAEANGSVLRFWDVLTGAVQRTLQVDKNLADLMVSENGRYLITSARGGETCLQDMQTGARLQTFPGHFQSTYGALSTDGTTLVTGDFHGTIRWWRVSPDAPTSAGVLLETQVTSAAFAADATALAVGGADGRIRIIDAIDRSTRTTLSGHTAGVYPIAISPDGRTLASRSQDHTLRIWDIATGVERETLRPPAPGRVYSPIVFSPDSSTLAIEWDDKNIQLLDLKAETRRVLASGVRFQSLAYSRDGRLLAAGNIPCEIFLWEVETGVRIHHLGVELSDMEPMKRAATLQFLGAIGRPMMPITFSPDGSLIACGASNGAALLWEVATGTLLRNIEGTTDPIVALAFSPDGRYLATGGRDAKVRLWDWRDGECLGIAPLTDWVVALAFRDATTLYAIDLSGNIDNVGFYSWEIVTGSAPARPSVNTPPRSSRPAKSLHTEGEHRMYKVTQKEAREMVDHAKQQKLNENTPDEFIQSIITPGQPKEFYEGFLSGLMLALNTFARIDDSKPGMPKDSTLYDLAKVAVRAADLWID